MIQTKKIPDTNSLANKKKTDFNAKVTEIESKIPSITDLATNSKLTAVENKIPDVSSLVKKTDSNAKIGDIESKYITTADYNKFTKYIVDNKIKSKNLIAKTNFNDKLKVSIKRLTQIKQNIYLLRVS